MPFSAARLTTCSILGLSGAGEATISGMLDAFLKVLGLGGMCCKLGLFQREELFED